MPNIPSREKVDNAVRIVHEYGCIKAFAGGMENQDLIDSFQVLINLGILFKSGKLVEVMGEKEIKSELLARHQMFFDFQEARISIGKLRELIVNALSGHIAKKAEVSNYVYAVKEEGSWGWGYDRFYSTKQKAKDRIRRMRKTWVGKSGCRITISKIRLY
jgi:hypothetical protein